ncbi:MULTISPECIES: putative glycoside hydrolase [Aerococcus]|uniref:Sugar fermentation stimulation protein n=2 Tax=Aerococcus TaxID=1375 RepID=A0A5N1GQK0_9LACT|nr:MULTISPECIES: putative glycoside hydrolase [Aerococcus]KAA9302331.1 sugar fermentation stimulation protein [Aerococcus sanguinicola]MDK6370011.1 putative glycoside hydrolase [Aerococcus sp. UMB9870]MDK6678988.1 putative glycoside hydrolase [Aerococcus sp. UMB8608]MDK6687525.1 putative glycoside hydrolase [Aerococcus sp. UMB8623]MDK6939647.1 putative glycoside hydrolase [Aerococcus sp. UMB8487]
MANRGPENRKKQVRKEKNNSWKIISAALMAILVVAILGILLFRNVFSSAGNTDYQKADVSTTDLQVYDQKLIGRPATLPSRFYVDSGVDIAYPKEGVKGIYLSATGMGTPKLLQDNINLIDNSGLNSVVIDVKSDWGSITTPLESDNPLIGKFLDQTFDVKEMMKIFEDKQIYPIARITTFKDTFAAEEHPEWSFKRSNGEIWKDASGQTFLNPYNKETWDYIVDVAQAAAKAGFKDIQFDYVRFPEGFETFGTSLDYDMGDYAEYGKDSIEARQQAITDFLAYAHDALQPYGVNVSADIFGYVTTTGSAPGIGQNYHDIAEQVDAISAMIYPSHWNNGDFGLAAPDLEPYKVVDIYTQAELDQLEQVQDKPIVRPWLQAFTASYLGSGNYKEYDAQAYQDQIDALAKHGVNEYLFWNAANEYNPNVDYK